MTRCVGAFKRPCPVLVPVGRFLCHGCWRDVESATSAGSRRLRAVVRLTPGGWDASVGQAIIRGSEAEAA